MARTRSANTTTTTTARKPSLISRLRGTHKTPARVSETSSTNPITGTRTTTKTTKTHPKGIGHHGHGGRGPMASTHHTTTTGKTTAAAPVHHHRRKPSVGDKVSGAMMKLKGSLTSKPGVKAAGTRRMHGTDGRGSHHTTTASAARY